MTILLLSLFTFGILPNVQTFRFSRRFPNNSTVLLRFLRSRSRDAPGDAASGLAATNKVVSSGEPATKCSGAALIKDPPWANHITAATCDSTSVGCSTADTLLQDQGEPSFHQDHDHDRHRPHLCSFGSISPTVQLLDFSVRVISHTGPYARSSERRHEQRLFKASTSRAH